MRRLRGIARILLLVVLGGYLFLLALSHYPPLQQRMTSLVASSLADKLNTEVSIGRVDIGLFNRVILNDVLIKDQANKDLLDAKIVSAKIQLAPLLEGKVALRTVSLIEAKVRLYQESPEKPANYQFIIDAFQSKEKKESSPLDLHVNSLILRRCFVSYDKHFLPEKPAQFNPNHLALSKVDANVSLKVLHKDSLNFRIRSLAFQEKSGFAVRSASFRFAANPRKANVDNLRLTLPNSHIIQPSLSVSYDLKKGLLTSLKAKGTIDNVRVATQDVAPFVPALRKVHEVVHVKTRYAYENRHLSLTDFAFGEQDGRLRMNANAHLHFADGKAPRISVSPVEMEANLDYAQRVLGAYKVKLPKEVLSLKQIRLLAEGNFDERGVSALKGDLQTDLGNLRLDATLAGRAVKAHLQSSDFDVATLSANPDLPHHANFSLQAQVADIKAVYPHARMQAQIASADFKSYPYRNVSLDGALQNERLSAHLVSKDPNASLDALVESRLSKGRLSDIDLSVNARRLAPSALNLPNKYPDAAYSFTTQAHLSSLSLKELQGKLHLNDFSMSGGKENYHLRQLTAEVKRSGNGSKVSLHSDFLDAELEGILDVSRLKNAILHITDQMLPGVLNRGVAPRAIPQGDQWKFYAVLHKSDFLQRFLHLPVALDGPLTAYGNLRSDGGHNSIVLYSDGLTYADNHIVQPRIYVQGEGTRYSLLGQAKTKFKDADVQLVLNAAADDGKLNTHLSWDDVEAHHYSGALSAQTTTTLQPTGRRIITALQPTRILVNDTAWTVNGGKFSLLGKTFVVDDFSVHHSDHRLSLDGRIGGSPADSLHATLHKVDVDYILALVNFKTLHFQGLATGRASLTLHDGRPFAEADLELDSLYMNESLLGHTRLRGGFDGDTKRILLDADIAEGDKATARVQGYVSPANKNIDLRIENHNLRVGFLHRYFDSFIDQLDARAVGNFRISGTFQDLEFNGSQDFSGRAHLLSTDVAYNFTRGHVEVTPETFTFSDVSITDDRGGKGTVTGLVNHDHLRDMRYRFTADIDHLHVYHQPELPQLSFYAQAFGTGQVALYGAPGAFSADIDMTTDKGSYIAYKADMRDESGEVPFITFRDRDKLTPADRQSKVLNDSLVFADLLRTPLRVTPVRNQEERVNAATDIRLTMNVQATPDAALRVIMDQKAGDFIELHGAGALRATYYNKDALKVFGPFEVESGVYRMSIQDLVKKEFTFTEGTLTFAGEPFQAGLNLKAHYSIPSVSLSGLYAGANLSQNNIPVNCLLDITGQASSPQVSFNLDLPTADSEVKQTVFNLINSQNDMNMQVLHLMGFNRFYSYSPGTVVDNRGQSQSMVAMKSLLSSTITSQVNEMLSNAMGTSNWSFGTNISTGDIGWSDMEVEGTLRGSMFNNRLLLNGNFGYRDRATSTRSSSFVGDFDLRYLLTPRGGISLKAYSMTNERYFTRSSLTTQGVGIMFRRDFTNLFDLFRRKRNKPAAAPAKSAK